METRLSVEANRHNEDLRERFRADAFDGLSRSQKVLPSKYFYDERGSELFDQICELEEYYLTRAELEVMERYADEMVEAIGPRAMLVEFGSGSSIKTQILLDHLHGLLAYVPVDISASYLETSTERLRSRYPDLLILPVAADYTETLTLPRVAEPHRVVVYFPGSTIGNFEPEAAGAFLSRIARLCGSDGGLIIGVDLRKDRETLEAAYNDASGVTAAFNLNLLVRINRELDGSFDLSRFSHRAIFNERESRIEMHLVSLAEQDVRVGRRRFHFRAQETILTEYSYKYDVDQFSRLAAGAGFGLDRVWTDERDRFSVQYLRPR